MPSEAVNVNVNDVEMLIMLQTDTPHAIIFALFFKKILITIHFISFHGTISNIVFV